MNTSLPKRLVLFSSYYAQPNIPYYVFYYLTQLRPHSDHLVYICTDDKPISQNDIQKLTRLVDKIAQVKNEGYDFGMWKKLLSITDLSQFDEILFVNDSCICINSLDSFFHWHQNTNADVTGLTENQAIQPHLQSFFLCIRQSAFTETLNFLKNTPFEKMSFIDITIKGEVHFSHLLRTKGLKLKAKYNLTGDIEPNREDLMYFYYEQLMNLKCPLIKKKFLQREKENINENIALAYQENKLPFEQFKQLFETI